MVMVMAKGIVVMEKSMVGMEKGTMAATEREKDMDMGNQVMVLITWKATLMGIRIRDPNYV